MTVPEAAIKILQEYPDGLSAKKVTDEILAHKLHPLPAKDPVQIVARAMNRHCIGIDRSYSCQDRFFTASKDNTGLLIYKLVPGTVPTVASIIGSFTFPRQQVLTINNSKGAKTGAKTRIMDAENQSVRDLLGKYCFHVPDYQRSYSWNSENIDEDREHIKSSYQAKHEFAQNQAIYDAFNKMKLMVEERLDCCQSEEDAYDYLKALHICVLDRFEIVTMIVEEEADAFLIFETLNDRGLALSAVDLIKNKLFQIFDTHPGEFEQLKSAWEEMCDNIENKDDLKKFILHYWRAYKGFTSPQSLYNIMNLEGSHAAEDKNKFIQFDVYYCCALIGMAAGQIDEETSELKDLVDKYPVQYRECKAQIAGLLVASEAKRLGIDTQSPKLEQIMLQYLSNNDTLLSEDGVKTLNAYALKGYRLITDYPLFDKPTSREEFLDAFNVAMQFYEKKDD